MFLYRVVVSSKPLSCPYQGQSYTILFVNKYHACLSRKYFSDESIDINIIKSSKHTRAVMMYKKQTIPSPPRANIQQMPYYENDVAVFNKCVFVFDVLDIDSTCILFDVELHRVN